VRCDCLGPLVWGHVCGRSGLPPGGWSNEWRELPDLHDAVPRGEPYDGDTFARWLEGSYAVG
jgi:hypothetical protein